MNDLSDHVGPPHRVRNDTRRDGHMQVSAQRLAAPTVDYLFSLQNLCDDRAACSVRTSHADYTILVRQAANCHVQDSSSSFDS